MAVRHATVEIVHERNSAAHVQDNEQPPGEARLHRRRAARIFDYADEQVTSARDSGRKGWLRRIRTWFRSRWPTATACGGTRPGRCLPSPTSAVSCTGRVRRLRPGPRALRQGQATLAAEAAQRGDRLCVDAGRPGRVGHRDPAPPGRARLDGTVAVVRRSGSGAPAGSTRWSAAYRDALGFDAGLDFHGLREKLRHAPHR